jgi:ribosomal protein S18 acetylase RimI-like enzyme
VNAPSPSSDPKLRSIRSSDDAFLRQLYASTRQRELDRVAWSAEQKEVFLKHQFDAQDHYYQKQFPRASFDVVELDKKPVGRLYVDRRAEEIRIIDIALLPEHRGRGLGGALIQSLLDEAAEAGKRVTIHVELENPARHLYDRLGFVPAETEGMHTFMEWTHSPSSGSDCPDGE